MNQKKYLDLCKNKILNEIYLFIFFSTKRLIVDVIRFQPGETLTEILETPATKEQVLDLKIFNLCSFSQIVARSCIYILLHAFVCFFNTHLSNIHAK